MKNYYANNKETWNKRTDAENAARNVMRRERYRNDPEYREAIKIKSINDRRKNPRRRREQNLRATYGITQEAYDLVLEYQGGGCAICGRKENTAKYFKYLHVDHDHTTGEVRGILCDSCNLAIGKFQDNPELLRRAADYLDGGLESP